MSISSTTNRVSYTGNGAVDTYAYTFRILDDDHLLVTVRDTSDVETTLTKTTDYTVTGVEAEAGGNVVLVNSAQAWLDADGDLKSDYILTIRRVVPLKQETDIRNQGDFYPEVHEDQFDLLVMADQQQQDEIDRSVKLPESVIDSDFDPTLPADIAGVVSSVPITNSAGDGFADAADWPTGDEISNAQTYATNASASATLASQWATLTSGQVAATDYSAKAWAIGGTGVTDTASRGAAKEWAIETASTVDGTDYSAKEWAKGTQVRGAASGGSSKDWATYTAGTADNSEYSAKEYAVGTQTRGVSGKGSAKDWATRTGATVDDTGYSSKEHAVGTTVTDGSSKDWASKTSATVAGGEYSAKEYAQGTQAGAAGSAKDWAQKTSAAVTGSSYSAKEWATGTQTRGAASGGSSKDWANYTGGTVDNSEYSAKKYATDAAASASSAASTLASALWRGVVRVSSTPYTVLAADNGKLHVVDSSGGAITVNLPALSGLTLPVNFGFKLDAGANAVTIDASGTDTIDGAATYSLAVTEQGVELLATVDGAPDDWETVAFGAAGGNLTVDMFSGDGSDTTFDLSVTPSSENNTQVFISGVYQQKNTYSISGTTVTFSAAPPSGTNNIEVVTGTTLSIGTPSDSTVTKAKLTDTALYDDVTSTSTTPYTVSQAEDVISISAAAGNKTINLPAAASNSGKVLKIVRTDAAYEFTVTVDGNGAETIGGSTTTTLNTEREALTIVSNGTNWLILNRYIPSAWTSFTPTGSWNTTSTYTGRWRRVGDAVEVITTIVLSGAATSAALTINLPANMTIDTAKLTSTTAQVMTHGFGTVRDTGTTRYDIAVQYNDTTSVIVVAKGQAGTWIDSGTAVTQAIPMTFASTDEVHIKYAFPISGWNG